MKIKKNCTIKHKLLYFSRKLAGCIFSESCWNYYLLVNDCSCCKLSRMCVHTCIVKKSKAPVIGYCVAQYDYEATATNQISLREGDNIAVVSKAGEATGWWKGNNNGRVRCRQLHIVKRVKSS